jgi:hypothetical protein
MMEYINARRIPLGRKIPTQYYSGYYSTGQPERDVSGICE